jgi:PAS domain S-box-containing protein
MTRDEYKTKEQLISELAEMRRRIAEPEASETERKQAEEQFQTLLDNIPFGVSLINQKGSYEYVNTKFTDIFGYTLKDVTTGKEWLEKAYPDLEYRRKVIASWLDDLRKAGVAEARPKTFVVTCKDGSTKDIQFRPITLSKGQQLVTYEDITERKQAEERLAESEEKYHSLVERANDGILVIQDGVVKYANPRLAELGGYSIEEIIGTAFTDYVHLDEVPKLAERYMQRIAGEDVESIYETVLKSKDGGGIDAEINAGIVSYQGKPAELVLVRDITQRKRVERELRESKEKLGRMLESVTDGISVVGLNGTITEVNQREVELQGFSSKDELLGKSAFELVAPRDHERVAANMRKALKEGIVRDIEYTLLKADGSEFSAELSTSILKDASGKAVGHVTVARGITERKRAEEALRESEEKYRALFEDSRDAVFISTRDGKLTSSNQAFLDLFGYTREEAIGLDVRKTYANPDDRLKLQQEIERKGEVKDFELRLRKKDRAELDCLLTATVRQSQDGVILGYQGIIRNITERKQAEEELRQSEENLKIYLESAPDGVFLCDSKGTFLYGNKKAEEIIGYKREELIGKSFLKLNLLPAKYLAKAGKSLALGAMGKPTGPDDYKAIRKDGSHIWTEITGAIIKQDGKIVGIGFVRDITERKLAEEALRESKEFSSSLLSDSPNPIHVINPDTSIQYVNPALEKITGYSSAELIGRVIPYPWWPEETRDGTERDFEEALHGGMRRVEKQFRKKNGEQFWVDITFTAVKHDGKLKHYLSNWTDITERKRAEEEIRKLSQLQQRVLDNANVWIDVLDEKANVVLWNKAAEEISGYSAEEVIGHGKIWKWLYPDEEYQREITAKPAAIIEREAVEDFETTIRTKDGQTRVISWNSRNLVDEDGTPTGSVALGRDVTERKEAEKALRESEEKHRTTFESTGTAMIIVEEDTTISLANHQFETLSGYSKQEIEGKKHWTEFVHQEDLEQMREYHRKRREPGEGAPTQYEFRFVDKGGDIKDILLTVDVIPGTKKSTASLMDITERKQMEAEKLELEQQAQMASRLATVGEMASGIAHEINNPLTAVIGYADLVLGRDIPQEAKDDVRIIHNGAKRVADIVKRLLTFARQYQPERTYLDINKIIKTTLELRAYELETSNIKVTTNLAPDLPRTMADAGQLQQVLLNLIINAETEMNLAHKGGKLLVKTETVDDTIRISFKDDGPGITKENLERIFNPFFTTREVGKGTGLGLSLCHGIIAEHNGRIYAKSKPGRGATFIVELPVITEEKQLEMAEPAEEAKKVAPARILVVDDEPAIYQFLERLLTGEGHEVETVTSAGDALERMKGTRYNLILLDIKLPGKSGIELYKRMQKIAESLTRRVVFITGDVMGTDTRNFLSRTRVPYITKPFDTEQLKRDLNRRLAGGA